MHTDEYRDYFLLENGEVVTSYNAMDEETGEKEYDRVYTDEDTGIIYYIKEGHSHRVVRCSDCYDDFVKRIRVCVCSPSVGLKEEQVVEFENKMKNFAKELYQEEYDKIEFVESWKKITPSKDLYSLYYIGMTLKDMNSADVVLIPKNWIEFKDCYIYENSAKLFDKKIVEVELQ